MEEQNYSNEHLLKVMLEVAQRTRQLNCIEERYHSIIDSPSESIKSEIISEMKKNYWISSHAVLFDPLQTDSNTSVDIFPMLSGEGERLTKKGKYILNGLISLFEDKRKEQRIKNINKALKWTFRVIAALSVAFIVWRLFWN